MIFLCLGVAERIQKMNPNIKLILLGTPFYAQQYLSSSSEKNPLQRRHLLSSLKCGVSNSEGAGDPPNLRLHPDHEEQRGARASRQGVRRVDREAFTENDLKCFLFTVKKWQNDSLQYILPF
jgi:hypothetical protein